MPLDPTLDELSQQQQASDRQSMTHQPPPPPNPVSSFLDYAQQPAPPRAPMPGEERINRALTAQDPRYVPMQPQQQQNWQRWAEEMLNNLPFGFAGMMGGKRGFGELAARGGANYLGDLEAAKFMKQWGTDRTGILQNTEWYKEGPSGIWNKEIFDYPSSLNMLEVPSVRFHLPKMTTVGKTLKHDDLYNVYPHLKDMPLIFKDDPAALAEGRSAYFIDPRPPSPNAPYGMIGINNPHATPWQNVHTSLLHELQHAVDKYEGRPLRTSKDFQNRDGSFNYNKYFKALEEGRARNTEWRSKYPQEALKEPGMTPWKTMEKMHEPGREEEFTLPSWTPSP